MKTIYDYEIEKGTVRKWSDTNISVTVIDTEENPNHYYCAIIDYYGYDDYDMYFEDIDNEDDPETVIELALYDDSELIDFIKKYFE